LKLPNIPTYTSRAPAPGGDSRIIQAKYAEGAAFADLLGTVAKTGAGLYQQQQERRSLEESSNLAASLATTQADLDLKWEEAKKGADPTSPDFAEFSDNFITKVVDPAIDALGQGVTTNTVQRQLRETQAKLRGKYRVQTTLDQAALSGAQAQENIITLGRVQADSVYTKPETLDISIGIVDHAIKGLIAAGLDRGAALELQRTLNAGIAESAFKGAANINPDAAVRALDAGKYAEYVPQVTQDEMRKYAEMQKESVEVDKRRAEADKRQAKEDAAFVANQEWSSAIIANPTKVDPRAIARDPRLSGEQMRAITNFQDEELRKLKGEAGDENRGPGFWSAYDRVFQGGFKSTDEIYAQARKGGTLTLPDADKLAALWRGRQDRTRANNFQDERVKNFFAEMRLKIARRDPRGFSNQITPEGEEAARKFFYDKSLILDSPGDKAIDDLIDKDSPNYIGKDWESYRPKPRAPIAVPPPPEAPRTWFDYFGGLLVGPEFKIGDLDKIQDANAGRIAARGAVATGKMTPKEAGEYLVKRGWATPDVPVQEAPTARRNLYEK
jgi:hypothetical protein